ncbi:Protein of unknown function DUF2329 [Sulfobacillus acidophilus TPY]|nr:Protein of unknown function DUF2329 [Sulfobacillus acidophilus TPY]
MTMTSAKRIGFALSAGLLLAALPMAASSAWAANNGTDQPIFREAPPLADLYAEKPLTGSQVVVLRQIAQKTWSFFLADTAPTTDLPYDNLGFAGAPPVGNYTSPTDIAMSLWAITAATELHLISPEEGYRRAQGELAAIQKLPKWQGFLLSWYSPTTGQPITGPGGSPVTSLNGQFISTVDNGWYASALVIVREAFPRLAPQATALLNAMNFGVFYHGGDETTDITAGQLSGGYVVGQGPTSWQYGNLNTDPRIAVYMGIGTGTVPGDVWWRTWRTLPADFTWQTQTPQGYWQTYSDPYSHQDFSVYEGHYVYQGISYVPSWGGSAFEALMAPLVVPEGVWGTRNFGLNNINYAEAGIFYAKSLKDPVWGFSPASVPGTSGAYEAYGAYPLGSGGPANAYASTAVAPYASFIALPWIPQQAFRNIQRLMSRYAVLGPDGFYDAVNPTTGQVAPRYLVLDQGMILAAIDDTLEQGGLQRYWAVDPVGERIKPYLQEERFSIQPVAGLSLSQGTP